MKERKILLKMGITSNLKGYHYILEAINIIKKSKGEINLYEIYKEISKKKKKISPGAVERAIRYTINKCWKEKSLIINIYENKPNNAAFLYDLVYNFDIFEN